MPAKVDKINIGCPFMDRRTKLLPCQKEMVFYWHNMGYSIKSISKMFKVNKRLIQFVLFPERQKRNIELRKERGGSKAYYKREYHTEKMHQHRKYKEHIFNTKNPIP